MVDGYGPRWSDDVGQAGWIAERLTPREDEYPVTIVVPAGFEAYARVLHPAQTPDNGNRLVRWAEVAAWERGAARGPRGSTQEPGAGPVRDGPRVRLT